MWPFTTKHNASQPPNEGIPLARHLDRQLEVFGASSHRYHTTRLSLSEIHRFEDWCGTPLPSAYKEHLLSVGYGAGPYYGLWSPDQIRDDLEGHFKWMRKEGTTPPFVYDVFPLTQSDAQGCLQRLASNDSQPWITASWPIAGCVPIGHQGCEYFTVLQLTGDYPGTVWDISECGSWLPARRPSGLLMDSHKRLHLPDLPVPCSFDVWFQGWLDRISTDFSPL